MLETEILNLNNRYKMRNNNYYKSVVIEFFPKDTEKYRDAVLSTAAVEKTGNSEQTDENHHDCCCNMCGDNINQRAQMMADFKFNALKVTHSKELVSKTKEEGPSSQLNENTDVSTQKLSELQRELDETKIELQSEIDASKQVNIFLLNEIQKYKTQKMMTEQNIL